MANTMMAAILQILLCLLLDITAGNLAGMLCMSKDVSLPLEEAELLSLAQLVWSRTGDSQCSVLAVKVWLSLLARWTRLCNMFVFALTVFMHARLLCNLCWCRLMT